MRNKKIAAMVLFGLTMTTCASPAVGKQTTPINYKTVSASGNLVASIEAQKVAQTLLEQEAIRLQKIADNTAMVNLTLKKLNSYVGKTWYVFSGNTPSGWDCSGLTMWFYEQLNINIEHRATKQAYAGKETESPKPGDIVVFKYNGSKSAYHVGIYIDEDTMIHAPKKGHVTRIESISSFAGKYSDISYRSLIETK